MNPGELWEVNDKNRACASKSHEAFTLNYTSLFYRLYNPFIILEFIPDIECARRGAWKVLTEMGVMYVQSELQYIARRIDNEKR